MVEAEAVDGHLDDLMADMARCFRRWEPRAQARKYVRALMSDLPRKNCWSIAEHAGDTTPGRMQHLLGGAKWDTMGAMVAVRTLVCQRLDDGDAVVILDESGQEKKGTDTVGVKRQYVGCAGRVSNAINVVYCSFATAAGHALVGARPYLPREQAAGPDRRERDRVSEHVVFATPWIFWAFITGSSDPEASTADVALCSSRAGPPTGPCGTPATGSGRSLTGAGCRDAGEAVDGVSLRLSDALVLCSHSSVATWRDRWQGAPRRAPNWRWPGGLVQDDVQCF